MSKPMFLGLVPITDQNRETLVRISLITYLGDVCICGHEFKEMHELDTTVWHPHETGRISHKECFLQMVKKDE